ncbi:MAG TPA: gluconate 2-dehydrogenase subunit 3 family protein [Candidatus Hydrogenedentes bacterium]|nr:gluconate 2-dehydrogenase subunit 3 family protein [Candidatus Hydrogenedentota bacterium]
MTTEITRRSMLGMTATTAATALSALSASNWIFAFDEDGSVVKAATKNGQWSPDFFSNKEITQLETLCETIIPKTDTAGASEARVHEYIDLLYSVDSEENQDRVKNGLKWLDKRYKKIQKSNIAKASPEQLIGLLEPLSDTKNSHPSELEIGVDLFRDLKAKTITGYYTSKEGRVEELGLPEHTMMTTYDGCAHNGEH